MGAPVQVTEQVLSGATVHLNPSEIEQVKNWELQFRVTEQVLGGDTVHLNLSEMERVKSSSSGERTG